jgi:catechol 2,3-dioxygenase-like lactoylglutathione lyase family enzyme
MKSSAPGLCGVLETVLYFSEEQRTAAFYGDVLGMRLLDREPGRSLFYRVGDSVFLLFRSERSLREGKLPAHGAHGPIHTCFRAPAEAYQTWKDHLRANGVGLIKEVEWPRGRSFYFHDPDGNLLEIANADIWPA